MACQNHKIAGVMQTVNSADGVLEAKNAHITDESANSERPKKRKKRRTERTKSRSKRFNSAKCALSEPVGGRKKCIFVESKEME